MLYVFADWHSTLWDRINVDSLVEECKKIGKGIRTLNKAVGCAEWRGGGGPVVACCGSRRFFTLPFLPSASRAPCVPSLFPSLPSPASCTVPLSPSLLPYAHQPFPHPRPLWQVRGYEVYRLLEEKVKAMMTALPLVQDLHHPAMRERHWTMLMKAGGGGVGGAGFAGVGVG